MVADARQGPLVDSTAAGARTLYPQEVVDSGPMFFSAILTEVAVTTGLETVVKIAKTTAHVVERWLPRPSRVR